MIIPYCVSHFDRRFVHVFKQSRGIFKGLAIADIDGDSYDAFNSLQSQISHLAARYFGDGPVRRPPDEVLGKIPTRLPSILLNMHCSKQLRVAYIEHLVSNAITQQIFEPFLFTLAVRRKSMDNLITEWSASLREKSAKRETIFRQHILHAAYTSSNSKQSINTAAGIVADRIFAAVKLFADSTNWHSINVGIRRIVKLAVETWRYARLEKGVITASLSDQKRRGALEPEHAGEPSTSAKSLGQQSREVVLPLFPVIEKQPIPEELRGELKEDSRECVYTSGRMLYTDDPLLLPNRCEQEQEQGQGQDKNNVSERKTSVCTDLSNQRDTSTLRIDTQECKMKPLKTGNGAKWPLVTELPLLSTLQPPFDGVKVAPPTSEPMNGAAPSTLATPVEDLAAIQSTSSRRQIPP